MGGCSRRCGRAADGVEAVETANAAASARVTGRRSCMTFSPARLHHIRLCLKVQHILAKMVTKVGPAGRTNLRSERAARSRSKIGLQAGSGRPPPCRAPARLRPQILLDTSLQIGA